MCTRKKHESVEATVNVGMLYHEWTHRALGNVYFMSKLEVMDT